MRGDAMRVVHVRMPMRVRVRVCVGVVVVVPMPMPMPMVVIMVVVVSMVVVVPQQPCHEQVHHNAKRRREDHEAAVHWLLLGEHAGEEGGSEGGMGGGEGNVSIRERRNMCLDALNCTALGCLAMTTSTLIYPHLPSSTLIYPHPTNSIQHTTAPLQSHQHPHSLSPPLTFIPCLPHCFTHSPITLSCAAASAVHSLAHPTLLYNGSASRHTTDIVESTFLQRHLLKRSLHPSDRKAQYYH